MKSFDEWFRQRITAAVSEQEAEDNLAEEKGLCGCIDHWSAKCLSCEQWYEIPCSVEEFDPDFSYCGGSPSCCP